MYMKMKVLLLLLTVFPLLLGLTHGQAEPIYFTLGDYSTRYTINNMEFLITDIGEDTRGGRPSLACHTDLTTCCRSGDNNRNGPLGKWTYPDGSLLMNNAGAIAAGDGFYFIRNAPQVIRLARRQGLNPLSPTGSYCCTVPTTGGDMTLCANLVVCPSLSLANGVVTYDNQGVGGVATHSCDPGYTLNDGASTGTCQSNGMWSGIRPICYASSVTCNDIEEPANGAVLYSHGYRNARPVGSTVTYTNMCNIGFIINDPTRTCQRDGMWSEKPSLTCVAVDCGLPSTPLNGAIALEKNITTFGSVVMYSCDLCYELAGTSNAVCIGDGSWVPNTPDCHVKQCSPPPPPVNGGVTLSPDSSCGSQVIYHCDPGYLIHGSDVRTCQPSGDWSGSAPVCEALDCGPLSAPTNGNVSFNSTEYLGVAYYWCDYGHELAGSPRRTCNEHGIWTPDAPLCNPVDCGSLPHPTNGQVDTSNGTTFASKAVYSCDLGYTLDGLAVRTCEGDGKWQPVAPICEIVDCGPLSHPVSGAVNTSNGTTYKSVAIYSCDNGYNINGPSQRTCTATGNWTDYPPTCDLVDCGVLPALQNGNIVLSEGTHFPSFASYSCDPGYNLTGCSTAQCQADGTWSCDPPVCANNVYIQLKFGPTSHCVDWSEKRVELIYTKMRSLILRAIQRYGDNEVVPKEIIAPGYFSCFQSMSEATFRTRITGTESVSAVEFAAMIQSWVESGVSSRLQWYIIKIDKNCPVLIESMEEDECQ